MQHLCKPCDAKRRFRREESWTFAPVLDLRVIRQGLRESQLPELSSEALRIFEASAVLRNEDGPGCMICSHTGVRSNSLRIESILGIDEEYRRGPPICFPGLLTPALLFL